jgi:hypothetical protein
MDLPNNRMFANSVICFDEPSESDKVRALANNADIRGRTAEPAP